MAERGSSLGSQVIMHLLVICSLVAFAFSVSAQESALLQLNKTIPLPGVKGRFDHFAADAKGHRIFVAALGNNTVEVADTTEGKHLKSISGLHKPTGVAYLAEANRIAIANGDDGSLKVFDGSTYSPVTSVSSLDDADNVRLDPEAQHLYVGFGNGGLSVLDVKTFKGIADIKLAAHPESFQLEQPGTRIFVNVPDAKQIAVIDRNRQAVIATWPMTNFRANFPMSLDEANHRLFVGCRSPARLLVLDTTTGKNVAALTVCGDTDDLFYDATLKRIYVSGGEGFVDVIEQRNANTYERRAHIPTRAGARTSFFAAGLNQLVVAVPARGAQSAELRVFEPMK